MYFYFCRFFTQVSILLLECEYYYYLCQKVGKNLSGLQRKIEMCDVVAGWKWSGWCERGHTAVPFCGHSEVEATDCLQHVSLLSALSTAPQQQDLVLAVDDALGLVRTLIAIEVTEAFGCSELA